MKETGSLCQVEQLPCMCLLESGTNGHHTLNHKRSSWTSSDSGVRNRPVAGKALCSSPECVTSFRLGSAEQIQRRGGGKALVTGGGGYFGFRLGKALAQQGISVILMDLNPPCWEIPDRAVYMQGDVRDYITLSKACAGVDSIFHTASYGMSGPEQLRKDLVESINVGGTKNIINVCCEQGITRLVYTSTVNVVFAGRPIEDGDEDSVPYVPLDMHIDHYSRTKAIAERMVLTANGRSLKGGGLLRTCVLRPSGIYGPEERRHLHRVMVNVESRLFNFTFGDPNARMNWVHVDNLVMAHQLAAESLTPEKGCVANGQTYFINDGESVNVFDWMTPLFERLGYSRPLIRLPVCLVYTAAFLIELLHLALRPIVKVPLLFTRNEVRNIAVGHTFRIDKARRELGFSPKKYSLIDSVDHYLKSRPVQSRSSILDSFLFFLMFIIVGVTILMFCWW